MESYITIKKRSRFEYEDRKSVFIGEAVPVSNEADALAFIESVRKRYPDARHHVYAYVLRENSIMRFTDDREPQGTAGMPVLDIIRKKGITDIAVVVTRYFGGTLLGTGGLVRAYSSAAQGAIEAAGIARYDTYAYYLITVSYSDFGKIEQTLRENEFRTEDTDYAADVTLTGSVLAANEEKLMSKLCEATGGRIKCEKIAEKFDC